MRNLMLLEAASFTIIIGIGLRTVPDIVYHIARLVLLVWGLNVAARARTTHS